MTALTLTHDQRGAQPWARTLGAAALTQVALLAVLSLLVGVGPVGWAAALGYAAAVSLALARGLGDTGALGPADKVTLARSTLVGCVTALVAGGVDRPAVLVGTTLVALVLDGVDGQVARRTGTASPLGARFDMEVDAFLILVLSVSVATRLGPWVLAIGLMRYAFIAAGRAVAWLRAPVPPTVAGKAVAVAQGAVLVVSTAGLLPQTIMMWTVAAALGALVWSFGRSVRWLYDNRFVPAQPDVAMP